MLLHLTHRVLLKACFSTHLLRRSEKVIAANAKGTPCYDCLSAVLCVFFFSFFHFSAVPTRYRAQEPRRWCAQRNCFKTFGIRSAPKSLHRCFFLIVVLQGAEALLSMCGVCVFRILNSKGWGLIMEPDSSSPASICLTVPPIFPSILSLPLFFFLPLGF